MEKVAEGLVAKVGKDLAVKSQKRSVGRDHFAHRIRAMGTIEKGKCQHTHICNHSTVIQMFNIFNNFLKQ
jgi:hypothetical protein